MHRTDEMEVEELSESNTIEAADVMIRRAKLLDCNRKLSRQEEFEYIKAAQKGDESAREFILLRYVRLAFKLAWKFRNRERHQHGHTPEDLFQHAMIAINKSIGLFDVNRDVTFMTYVYRGIEYELIQCTRKCPSYLSIDEEIEPLIPGRNSHEQNIDQRELAKVVRKCLARLSSKQRDAVQNFYGIDQPKGNSKDLAAREGVSHQAVHFRLKEGRALIKDMLLEFYPHFLDTMGLLPNGT